MISFVCELWLSDASCIQHTHTHTLTQQSVEPPERKSNTKGKEERIPPHCCYPFRSYTIRLRLSLSLILSVRTQYVSHKQADNSNNSSRTHTQFTPYECNFVLNPLIYRSDSISMLISFFLFRLFSILSAFRFYSLCESLPRSRGQCQCIDIHPNSVLCVHFFALHHLNFRLTIYYPKMDNKLE